MSPMFWHYTVWAYLPSIVADRCLHPTNVGAESERPLLWFSANQKREPTATKMVSEQGRTRVLSFKEQAELFGCIRFGLPSSDPRLLAWKAACAAAGTPDRMRVQLEHYGRTRGANPADWFATEGDMQLEELTLCVWLQGRWRLVAAPDVPEMADVWMNRGRLPDEHP